MLVIEEAMRNGDIPEMPVHLDGMIWEATAIHTTYPEYLRDDLRDRIFDEDENPFLADQFNHIDGGEDERQDVADGEPCIVLSTSGMVTGGPITSWLEHLGPDPDSSMVFVGYQARGTLGRHIQNGQNEIPVGDASGRATTVSMEMNVETVDGFSGHADRQGLENFVRTMNPRPRRCSVSTATSPRRRISPPDSTTNSTCAPSPRRTWRRSGSSERDGFERRRHFRALRWARTIPHRPVTPNSRRRQARSARSPSHRSVGMVSAYAPARIRRVRLPFAGHPVQWFDSTRRPGARPPRD